MTAFPRLYSMHDKPMWASIAADAMRLQRCSGCGEFRYPPGPVCPKCLSMESSWECISGRGCVLSWTTFHRQYLPAYPAPATVVAVRLQEGPIMIANVGREDAGALAVDASVEMIYADHADGYRIPSFRLVGRRASAGDAAW